MMFKCTLVKNGIVQERFFREGESAKEVKDGLELFQWPKGTWRISAVSDLTDADE